ncbi:zinc transporter SLC39A9 [Paracoccidioides lutzii Pb01]|uniref:Zinc transporter SLC39A9 n=1 Tax=Paracoccidioides lutzii (strain ATCC MYA-826 / Pb01) TaxID=502779 RepID=C1GNL0_PARBA|nr:zinc transporter SLC39A9 [Paracoccidioides lutzii Pb01]EEH35782.2 zinc transporter SLC39A9 [Paracoccidioides lutzii Pb01]
MPWRISSFVVGSLPLSFSLSSSQLRLISALGMGVLVGTSLIVIIPEGVETLYSSSAVLHTHSNRRDINVVGRGHTLDARWHHSLSISAIDLRRDTPKLEDKPKEDSLNSSPEEPGEGEKLHQKQKGNEKDGKIGEDNSHQSSPHAWIGVALIGGFILMYLVDTLPSLAASSTKHQQRPYHISLDNLSSALGRTVSPSRTGGGSLFDTSGSSSRQDFATTTGLVIHSAADGIALGASTSSTSLNFIIFLAIMVHKAPASFGLTSVLLRKGLSTRAARGHLLIFSLAAPVGALVTWIIAHTVLSGHVGDEQATKWRTGMLLLFSAGTFLYVAMHTMQDPGPTTADMSGRDSTYANGYAGEGRENSHKSQQKMVHPTTLLLEGVGKGAGSIRPDYCWLYQAMLAPDMRMRIKSRPPEPQSYGGFDPTTWRNHS